VSISAIGLGDGLGVGVGLGVAVGATDAVGVAGATDLAAVGDGVTVTTLAGVAPHATNRTASRTAMALILLG
jgi:hypothetical protein